MVRKLIFYFAPLCLCLALFACQSRVKEKKNIAITEQGVPPPLQTRMEKNKPFAKSSLATEVMDRWGEDLQKKQDKQGPYSEERAKLKEARDGMIYIRYLK